MANKDLRDWIRGIEAADELKIIKGAEPKEEIGGFVDIYQRKMGNPALMFDEVPGFPKGHRIIANILTSVPRINLALGLPPQGPEMELIQWWRNYMKNAPSQKPKPVNGGPLLDNVLEGKNVNIQSIPTPVWHERDGGPFIGTACMVAMRDPDSGWVNYGCYRIQSQGSDVATVFMSPGKHGRIIMGKYHERKQPCPVAVIVGMHPAMLMLAGLEIPYGKSEIEAAGGILGEGTGYYPSGSHLEPAIRIATMMHRNNPILMGAIPAVPPNDNTFYLGIYRCGAVWNQLEAAGIPGIQGVWAHEAGGSRFMLTVSIKQLYGGHAKQAGMVASHCHAGAYCNRWTIVVDDDIDPTNMNDVIWAMCTRCDPRDQVDIIHGGWSSALDPMCYDTEDDRRNSRVVVDACVPFRRKKTFPKVARSSKGLDERMRAKWAKDLPKGF